MLLAGHQSSAAPFTWEGDGSDAGAGAPAPDAAEVLAGEQPFKDWNDGANWDASSVPGIGDDLTFGVPSVAGAVNVAYDTPVAANSININSNPLAAYELAAYGAGKLTLAAGGSINFGDNVPAGSISGPIELSGSANITGGATAASFNLGGASITGLAAGTLTLSPQSGTASSVGAIHGPLNVVRTGAGAIAFAGQSTYSGSTHIYAGTTRQTVDNALPATTVLTVGNGAVNGVLRLDNGSSVTLAGLTNLGTATNSNGINANSTTLTSNVTIDNTQFSAFNGRLGASGAASQNLNFIKDGPGNFTMFTTSHTYTGSTSVLGGTLEIDSGQLQNTSGLTVNGGRFLYRSSTAFSKPTTLTAGTFGGTGNINIAITVGPDVTISPGGDVDNTTGVLSETIANQNYQAGLTFGPDGAYHYDLDAATGDLLAVTGALDITATGSDPFVIDLFPTGLTPLAPYQRTIATATSITGFSADRFLVLGGIGGTVSQQGNSLVLNFTAVPEPAGLGLLAVCGAALIGRRRK